MNANSPVTTHVLDTARGVPAEGLLIELEVYQPGTEEASQWIPLACGQTNSDGRLVDLLAPGSLELARYRLSFQTGDYFAAQKTTTFYPVVRIEFNVSQPHDHYHVPLLLSPFGYTTYRGS